MSVTLNSITLRTSTGVKNQTSQRSYTIEDRPVDKRISGSIFMDSKFAFLSWLTIRGPSEGFVFCDVRLSKTGICKMDPSKPLSSDRFRRCCTSAFSALELEQEKCKCTQDTL